MNNADVTKCLQRLAGIYRDPSRVSRDTSSLLNATVGRHLHPEASTIVQNDGSISPSLVLKGTVVMVYRGASYNIPIDIYLPPTYPVRPPIIYVRPVSTMMIKEGHRHVGADGMVYMPYLHSWRPDSHNMIDTCHNMSSIFGRESPVFAKPLDLVQSAPVSAQTARPTPPSYEDISTPKPPAPSRPPAPAGSSSGGFSDIFNRFTTGLSGAAAADDASAEERIIAETAAANLAVEVARKAEEAEAQDKKAALEARERLTARSNSILKAYRDVAGEEIFDCVRDQILLEKAKDFVMNGECGQIAYLVKRKIELVTHHKELDKGIEKLAAFVHSAEETKSSKKEVCVDELAVPSDILSAQMLNLSAENQSINDALYFLDKALADHNFPLDDHLRAVRKLTKKQFLVKAHLLKIGQVKASEAATKSAWG